MKFYKSLVMKILLQAFLILFLPFYSCQSQGTHDCPFPYSAHSAKDQCGFLAVPQNRSDPQSPKINIAYLVIKSQSKNPKPDPVVFLQGGPGGIVLQQADGFSQLSIDPTRDFILFDQRGIGFSNPICTNLGEAFLEVLALDIEAEQEYVELEKHLALCVEEQSKGKGDIRNYNTRENAADLEDLRKHLGYEKWNLYGGSYGTRLALVYMNVYPNSVRSSTLISIFPPQVHMYEQLISHFDRSLNKVFTHCQQDPDCNRRYPKLKKTFFKTLEEIKARPLSYTYNNKPFTLNAQDFLLFIHQMLYARSSIAGIPTFIMDIKNRKTSRLASTTNSLNQRMQYINMAVFWSTMAGDEGGFDNMGKLNSDLKRHPKYEPGISMFLSDPHIIDSWYADKSTFKALATTQSDIPTLLINGGFDPITPPENARLAASTLSNAYVSVFEDHGHTPFNDCFFDIARDFLNNPKKAPNDACSQRATPIRWK